jgi:hypothetical protein
MSKSRAKGTAFETDLVKWFRENGWPDVERLPFSSPLGDLDGLPITAEAKNQAAMKLPEWLAQAEKSAAKRGLPFFVFHKRVRKPIGKTYVTTELEQLAPLLLELVTLRSASSCTNT